MSKKSGMQFIKSKLPAAILILTGSITWSLTMVKSGLVYPFGMGFWGPNGHDGVWHLALINHLVKGNFDIPTFAGEPLQNYHIGFDLLLAGLHRLTLIPAHILYFQVIAPVVALVTGVLTYKFVLAWRASKAEAFWSTFFVYFGGSFGPIVTLVRSGDLGGESMFWAQQAISTLINPPFALSVVLFLAGLLLLLRYDKAPTTRNLLLTILVFGLLAQIKVYAGILALGALLVTSVFQQIRHQRFDLLKVFFGSAILSAVLFIPLNRGSSSLVVWQPFWFLENMMALSDRADWPKFYEAMVSYRYGNVWPKMIPAYLAAFTIFWIGNMGARVLGVALLWRWVGRFGKIALIEVFLTSLIVGGTVLPMLFLQRGTPWNTVQFFYYSLVFSGVLAGVVLGGLVEKWKSSMSHISIYVTYGLVILFTLPTTYATLRHYLPGRPPARIPHEELAALEFLASQPDGIVLTYPFDAYAAELAVINPPRPLHLYESTAYVSAFSAKSVYLEDEVNLNITGYDWRARRGKVEEFLASLDREFVRSFLRDNNIEYIYWVGKQRAKLGETQLGVTQIFENSQVKIYSVN